MKLKHQGLIDTERAGRNIIYRLTDTAASSAIEPKPQSGRKKRAKSKNGTAGTETGQKRGSRIKAQIQDGETLRGELAKISARFAPINDLPLKLNVLDQLAQVMPREVASVLKAIKGDLIR